MEQDISYTEALKALKELVSNIESDDVSLDELEINLKCATTLLETCKLRLKTVEDNTAKIIAELQNTE
ncbi:MAG: exodeoxyribonuclease VII small subunit [Bacteroidales bacterium]|jgi:exodeoxyribonuclease VII small subunit|nr:exodeoxyribonuclease VII small subunit [Bacteroidales bacterium]